MPRIHQNAEKYATEDFQREIRQRQGFYNIMSQRALAKVCGIKRSTLDTKLKEPDRLQVTEVRKLVKTLHPDPLILLALFGYGNQELKKVKTLLEEIA